jgi:hypothetical protein
VTRNNSVWLLSHPDSDALELAWAFEWHSVVADGEVENLHPVGLESGEAHSEGGLELVAFLGVVRALRVVAGGESESLCSPEVAEHLFTGSAAVAMRGMRVRRQIPEGRASLLDQNAHFGGFVRFEVVERDHVANRGEGGSGNPDVSSPPAKNRLAP